MSSLYKEAYRTFPAHMLSNAAERMLRLRSVSGPKVTGVNKSESIFPPFPNIYKV